MWTAISGSATSDNGEGGFANTSAITVNPLRSYRFSCWVYLTGPTDGNIYLGIGSNQVNRIPAGTTDDNPYFHATLRSNLQTNRWYLFVGIVLDSAYSGAQLGLSGIYDGSTGQRLQAGSDYKWVSGQATANLRSFQYYTVGTGRYALFCNPRFDLLDGSEPSLAALMADAILSRANTAFSNAATAQTDATTANTALANIASDSILSPSEKPSVRLDYDNITTEQAGIDSQATAYGITTEKTSYDSAVTALTSYLGGLSGWSTIPGSDVAIVGTTFRSSFGAVYQARQALLNKIAAVAGTVATWAGIPAGTGKAADNATVGATWGSNITSQPSNAALYNNYTENGILHVARPLGAAFSQAGDSIAGAIKITLPQSWTNTMLRFFVEIYEYTGSGSATYEVGGYNNGTGARWYNTFARYSGPNLKRRSVTFGHDGTNCCIWIGGYSVSIGGPAWSYPQVRVSSFVAGYSSATESLWATGWSITMATSGAQGSSPVIITAPTNGDVLVGNNLFDSAGTLLTDAAIKNSLISISDSGALSGAGGGKVTIGGLGYTGALNANYITNTNQITDGANLGGTAVWSSVSSRPGELTDGRIVTAINSSGVVIAKVKPTTTASPGAVSGLYLGSDNMGFFDGSVWKTYMDASGRFYLGGTSGTLTWDGSSLIIGGNGVFSGLLSVGSSPLRSGTTMTGSGARINPDGTFAIGDASTNITYNGSQITLNGAVVSTGNVLTGAITNIAQVSTAGPVVCASGVTYTELCRVSVGSFAGTPNITSQFFGTITITPLSIVGPTTYRSSFYLEDQSGTTSPVTTIDPGQISQIQTRSLALGMSVTLPASTSGWIRLMGRNNQSSTGVLVDAANMLACATILKR